MTADQSPLELAQAVAISNEMTTKYEGWFDENVWKSHAFTLAAEVIRLNAVEQVCGGLVAENALLRATIQKHAPHLVNDLGIGEKP